MFLLVNFFYNLFLNATPSIIDFLNQSNGQYYNEITFWKNKYRVKFKYTHKLLIKIVQQLSYILFRF